MDAAMPSAGVVTAHRYPRRIVLAGYALAACGSAALAAAISASGASDHPALVASARALIVGAPIAVGLCAWDRRRDARFGLVLVGVGVGLLATTPAESSDEVLYTAGRTAGWLVEVLLVYLILSFPTGRLSGRTDRMLVGAMAAAVATMYLPRLLLAADFEVPSPYTSCVRDCPPNALFALDHEPAFVDGIMRPLGVAAVFAVMTAVVVGLRQRIRRTTPLARRMLIPVLAISIARAGALGVALAARAVDPGAWPIEVAAWVLALAVPLLALALLAGLLRWRLFAEHAMQRLAECLRTLPDAVRLRRAFAEAFDDPTLQIVFPLSGSKDRWMDSAGQPVELPSLDSGRSVSEVRGRGTLVAAIVHDDCLRARPELVQAGVAMAGVVLDNQRLAAEAAASLHEVRESRARIAASAERERRRIERDLHDGAQQRLVALRIELELAEDLVRHDPEHGAARLRDLEGDVDDALEELRTLAHGVYPPVLADRGLAEALRAVAARTRIDVDVHAHSVARYPPEVESAVYFCVLEALQNVHKHAPGARRVVIRLDGDRRDELQFSVHDDGPGTRDGTVHAGAGIRNMQDRIAAIGGEVAVTSTPGVGTTVRGRAPAPAEPAL
jgi:signal transduction histidine kinase